MRASVLLRRQEPRTRAVASAKARSCFRSSRRPLGACPGPLPSRGTGKCQRACKPGSVHPRESGEWAAIPLGDGSPRPSSNQPGRRTGMSPYAAPIRSCTRWGLPCRRRCRRRGALLPHPFDLTCPKTGGILSVALSLIPAEAGTAGRYPAPLFRGARTFLAPRKRDPRPPGPLARGDIVGLLRAFESAANPLLRMKRTAAQFRTDHFAFQSVSVQRCCAHSPLSTTCRRTHCFR